MPDTTLTVSLVDEAPPPRCPTRLNLAAHTLFAGQTGDRIALTVASDAEGCGERYSYDMLRERVRRAAGGLLAAGLEPGDRVMLRLGNTADFPVLFLATIAAGGVAVPTSALLAPGEAAFIARDVGARFLCKADDLAVDPVRATILDDAAIATLQRADPARIADTAADDAAFVVYTSGSSGTPKGVVHAHRSAFARRMMWDGWYGLTAADRMLHAGAFNWTYTLGAGLLDPWAAGAATVIYAGPRDPGIWPRLARRHGCTLFAATPGVYRQLLKYGAQVGEGFAGLRHGLSAGEALPDALAEAWAAETGKPVFEALGMSEVSTYISSAPDRPRRPGWAGRPQRGRRVAVLEPGGNEPAPVGTVGDLAVSRRDPGLMLGYWNAPEETEAAFRGEWFVTGDLAEMAPDGYVAHRGRADDVMNAGGYRVAPQEVEAALAGCPGVLEAAAAAVEVRPGVSIIALFVVPEPGARVEPAAVTAWCASRLAAYKQPRHVEIVDALPRTATGKLLRRALRVGAH
jgi:acyl-coenzyme A synthetase/AMP-(fatty) acid ligase